MNKDNEIVKKNFRLDSIHHVKRFMQSVINDYNKDIISDVKAKTLATLVNSYTKVIELVRIEDELNNKNKPPGQTIANSNLTNDELIEELESMIRGLTK